MKTLITTFLLLFTLFSSPAQDFEKQIDTLKGAMYGAGLNLKKYSSCMAMGVCLEGAGVIITIVGTMANNDNISDTKNKPVIPATTYIGVGFCAIGAVVMWLAPEYIRIAGVHLRGEGFSYDIPKKRRHKAVE